LESGILGPVYGTHMGGINRESVFYGMGGTPCILNHLVKL